jgi:hypothetical protein
MSIGEGFQELAKVASDYTNNGMGQGGAYAAVRAARSREAIHDRDKAAQSKAKTTTAPANLESDTNPPAGDVGDATPKSGDSEVA